MPRIQPVNKDHADATALSFLLSTPGVFESSLGFPGLSVVPRQFLLKDVVLLGAAMLTSGEPLRASEQSA